MIFLDNINGTLNRYYYEASSRRKQKKIEIKIENKFEMKILGLNSHFRGNAKSAPYTGTITNNNNILIYMNLNHRSKNS